MLDTVKSYISEVKTYPNFSQFYLNYVFAVQDMNIEQELHSMQRYQKMNLSSYQILIQKTLERVIPS